MLARRACLLALAALALAACTVGDSDDTADDDPDGFATGGGKADSAGADWTAVGLGVAYHQVNTGGGILIAYGGYTAKLGYSAAWATELVDARLGATGVGHIYAVQGPRDASYAGREIANTKLRAHLATIDDGTSPIYVVAHSSGAFVAHEMIGQLRGAGNTSVMSRIVYLDLDGGGGGLTPDIVAHLGAIAFVHAHDPTLASGDSHNASVMRALASAYAPHATGYEVVAPRTGCVSGATWCLHDALITSRPHDAYTFDLADDYTDFAGRAVITSYLDAYLPPD